MLKIFLLATLAIGAHGVPPRPKGDPCPDGDGFYSIGCSNHYLRCVNGQEFVRDCPAGLYFNRILSRCERRQNVYSCEHRHRNEHMIRQKAFEVDCVNRRNGIYSFKKNICVDKFYMCYNGIGAVRDCPDGQYYIAQSERCDSLEVCESYIKIFHDSDAVDHASNIPKDRSVTKTEIEKPDDELDCAMFEGMTLSQNLCEPHFWQCTNGKLLKKTCPEGLKYDIENHHCNYPKKMNGCKNCEKISEDVTTTNMDEAVEQLTAMEQSAGATPKPSAPTYSINFVCHNRSDGVYDMGTCQEFYVYCIDGKTNIAYCDSGRVYDAKVKACEYPKACKEERKNLSFEQF